MASATVNDALRFRSRIGRVAVPVVDDDGVDLVVNYRTTVQVKSSVVFNVNPVGFYPYWSFKSPCGWRADVYVFRGIDEERKSRWWVVPHAALVAHGAKTGITVSPSGRGRWAQAFAPFEDAWDVFDA